MDGVEREMETAAGGDSAVGMAGGGVDPEMGAGVFG